MSKKSKEKYTKPRSPFKVVLPVLCGLVVVLVASIIMVVVSQPASSATVNDPKGTYATIGDLKVTNQKMYETLRNSGGVNTLTYLMDSVILKDVEVTDEDIKEVEEEVKYGHDMDENKERLAELDALEVLTPAQTKEKEKLTKEIEEYNQKAELRFEYIMKSLGYETIEERKAYFTVLAKREVYAEKAYNDEITANDFTDAEYIEAYKKAYKDENTSSVIAVVFHSSDQAKAYLELLSKPVVTTSLSSNWKFNNEEINKAEIDAKTALLETATEDEKKALEESIKALKESTVMSQADVAKAYIELYNIVNAYYLGGDVSSYFENDKLKPEFELLKKDVHYTIKVETKTVDGKEVTVETVEFNKEKLEELTKENPHCKFVYTDEEAKNQLSTSVTTLDENGDKPYISSPTKTSASSSTQYYLAYKFASYKAQEKSHYEELVDKIAELDKALATAEGEEKTSKETEKANLLEELNTIKAELRETLKEEKFSEDVKTRLLVEKRQASGLVIYDRYLNATYSAAYKAVYDKLKIEEGDYPEYASDGKKHKIKVFEFKDGNEVISYSSDDFFKELSKLYGHQAIQRMTTEYALLSNPEYNKVYNPYTGKIYDRDAYLGYLESDYNTIYTQFLTGRINSVHAYKFGFENGVFDSYGFTKEYGWSNFLKDYLLVSNEKELVATLNLANCEELFILSKTANEKVKEEMDKIHDSYYSLKGVKLVVYVDYNHDYKSDEYALDESVTTNWTTYQDNLAKELVDDIYEAMDAITDSDKTTEAKLKEVVEGYNKVTYKDQTWGKYIQAGIYCKVNNAADLKYSDTATETEAQESLDIRHEKMASIYKLIEKETEGFKLGAWTDEEKKLGYTKGNEAYVTSDGYNSVVITDAQDRIYVDSEKSKDYTTLTMEDYKAYMKDANSVDNTKKTAITTYLEPAVNSALTEQEISLLEATLRKDVTVNIVSDAVKASYEQFEAAFTKYYNDLIKLESEK